MDKLLDYQCKGIIKRVMAKSASGENGCINFKDTKHKYGLVSVTVCGKRYVLPAHRAIWMANKRILELPSSVVIRHKCDNKRCVNVDHLIDGTHRDNVQDCVTRGGRATSYRKHTRHRVLDDATVLAIRNAIGKQAWIAEEFGVSVGYVSKIRSGQAKSLITSVRAS